MYRPYCKKCVIIIRFPKKYVCVVKEQAGGRWFLEKLRCDAGSSPMSQADLIAVCYQMWRHSLAYLVDTTCKNSMHIMMLQVKAWL